MLTALLTFCETKWIRGIARVRRTSLVLVLLRVTAVHHNVHADLRRCMTSQQWDGPNTDVALGLHEAQYVVETS